MADQSDNKSQDPQKSGSAAGGQAAQGGQTSGAPPRDEPADESAKGGQIAQDKEQTTGLGGMS